MQQAPEVFGNINSFPTIRMYLTNKKINYDGSRDLNTLSSFIKSNVPDLKSSSSHSKPKTPEKSVKPEKPVKKAKAVKTIKKTANKK
jgi:hypothetical protein